MPEIENNYKKESYYGVGSFILELLKIFFLAFIIIIPVRVFLFQPFFVQGASMEPNFEDNQYLIVNEFGYKETNIEIANRNFLKIGSFRDLQRDDVIVFRYPKNPSQFFIKRIVGLPEEKIEVKDNQVKIFNDENPEGFILDESEYLSPNVKTLGDITLTLKDNEYFVMGDNRQFSSDSRFWGPVKKSNIVGKVLIRAWPLKKIEVF